MTCNEGSCHDPSCLFARPGRHWSSELCPHACIEDGDQIFCALSEQPDPGCAPGAHCDGNIRTACRGDFATERTDCSARDMYCVGADWEDPLCALSSEPDARCVALGYGDTLCDENQWVECRGAYATSARTCEVACVSPQEGWAFCAASSDRVLDCRSGSGAIDLECPGDDVEICSDGYVACLERAMDADAGTP